MSGSSSESFDISVISSDSLRLQFKIHSTSCARQMTSLFVRIYPDGIETALPLVMQIPRSCFKKIEVDNNGTAFLMTLSANAISSCSAIADWKPLQLCRQYRVVLQVEYSSKWKSSPFIIWDKFMSSEESQGIKMFDRFLYLISNLRYHITVTGPLFTPSFPPFFFPIFFTFWIGNKR